MRLCPSLVVLTVVLASTPSLANFLPEFILPGEIAVSLKTKAQLKPSRGQTVTMTKQVLAIPGGDSLLSIDTDGRVSRLDSRGRQRGFLNIASVRPEFMREQPEQGLLAVALHPEFSTPRQKGYGVLYTVHTERVSTKAATVFQAPVLGQALSEVHHYDVLMEWRTRDGGLDQVAPESGREILVIAQPFPDRNTGYIGFNPTANPGSADYGMLYLGVGDGGNTVPRFGYINALHTAQAFDSPLGKILRINRAAGPTRLTVFRRIIRLLRAREHSQRSGLTGYVIHSSSVGI